MTTAGWYPDPTGRFEFRWFDGATWSSSVSRGGQQFSDDPTAPSAPLTAADPLSVSSPGTGFGPPPGFVHTPIIVESPVSGSGSRTPLIVGAVLVVIALIVGGIVLANHSSTSGAVNSSRTTPATDGSTPSLAGDSGSRPVQVTGTALTPFDDTAATDAAVGTAAPVLQGFDVHGKPITIGGPTKGPVMVVFLAHWCPHCNREIPRLIQWQTDGGVPKNLTIIGVATAVAPTAVNYPPDKWLVSKQWPWAAMIDQSNGEGAAGVAATAYGASGWPYFVIIGADGLVKARSAGEIQITDLQSIVDKALAS